MDKSLSVSHLNLEEHLNDPGRKQRYVNAVFESIAGSYDRFTRLCSCGFDLAWKRDLVRLLKSRLQADHVVVDLATGTGDLAFALAPSVRRGRVLGIDLAENMIRLAEQSRRARRLKNVEFRLGDLMATGLPSGEVDAVTVGYGLRNCPNYRLGLREIHRVLKPGGWLASLEFVRPPNAVWEFAFRNALLLAGNFHGWLWHGEPAVYGYLAHSIKHFATNQEYVLAMVQAGFEVVTQLPKLAGCVYIHLARKKG